jgi:tetraacyldisaccharide 4'-kinase
VVGNITAGGTGKTPLVLWLVKCLRDRGRRPGIVSRGYGGTEAGPARVEAGSDPLRFGDEPVLLARRSGCTVWIGADRVAAARALLAAHPECDVVVSDDGLQHHRLARDVEICVVDAARGFGNGWRLPAGPLRDPVSRLATVAAVVMNGSDVPHPSVAAIPPGPARFSMSLAGREFRNLLDPAKVEGAESFRGERVHAVAGIGHPQRFFRHLQEMGLDFTPHAFPDHHPFTASDLAFAGPETVLMTEKDAVKCRAFATATHWALAVDAQVDAALGELILRKLESANHESRITNHGA